MANAQRPSLPEIRRPGAWVREQYLKRAIWLVWATFVLMGAVFGIILAPWVDWVWGWAWGAAASTAAAAVSFFAALLGWPVLVVVGVFLLVLFALCYGVWNAAGAAVGEPMGERDGERGLPRDWNRFLPVA